MSTPRSAAPLPALALPAAAMAGALLTLALPTWAAKDKPADAAAEAPAPKEGSPKEAGAKGGRQECAAFPVVLVLNAQNVETGARDGTTLPTGWTAVGGAALEGRPVAIACRAL